MIAHFARFPGPNFSPKCFPGRSVAVDRTSALCRNFEDHVRPLDLAAFIGSSQRPRGSRRQHSVKQSRHSLNCRSPSAEHRCACLFRNRLSSTDSRVSAARPASPNNSAPRTSSCVRPGSLPEARAAAAASPTPACRATASACDGSYRKFCYQLAAIYQVLRRVLLHPLQQLAAGNSACKCMTDAAVLQNLWCDEMPGTVRQLCCMFQSLNNCEGMHQKVLSHC